MECVLSRVNIYHMAPPGILMSTDGEQSTQQRGREGGGDVTVCGVLVFLMSQSGFYCFPECVLSFLLIVSCCLYSSLCQREREGEEREREGACVFSSFGPFCKWRSSKILAGVHVCVSLHVCVCGEFECVCVCVCVVYCTHSSG